MIPGIAEIARPFLSILLGAVGLVLVIACANVAGLVTARGEERGREIAVRAAIGASRRRVLRQLLVENLTLACAGGVSGVALSGVALGIVRRYQPTVGSVPVDFDAGMDLRVLAFSLAVTMATGLIFGLLPAIRTARTDLVTAMKQAPGTSGRSSSRLRSALVVTQVALSTVLLVASGLLMRGLIVGSRMDPGFESQGIAVARLTPELVGYREPETRALWKTLADRLASSAAVDGLAYGRFVPLGGGSDRLAVVFSGDHEPGVRGARDSMLYNIVDTEYFELLGILLLAGRNFAPVDRDGVPPVVVVNGTLANLLDGPRAALGETLRITGRDGIERATQIVGVVADTKYRRLSEGPTPMMFLPQAQVFSPDMQLHVRSAGELAKATALIMSATRAHDSELAVEVEAMDSLMGWALLPTKIAGVVLAVAGSMALLLAASGLFAIVSYAAAQRLREIGIRVALGATTSNVGRLVLLHGVRLTMVGLATGALAAFVLGRLLSNLLVGVSPADPLTFATCGLVLAAVSVAAGWLPARRAARADPVDVLRAE